MISTRKLGRQALKVFKGPGHLPSKENGDALVSFGPNRRWFNE